MTEYENPVNLNTLAANLWNGSNSVYLGKHDPIAWLAEQLAFHFAHHAKLLAAKKSTPPDIDDAELREMATRLVGFIAGEETIERSPGEWKQFLERHILIDFRRIAALRSRSRISAEDRAWMSELIADKSSNGWHPDNLTAVNAERLIKIVASRATPGVDVAALPVDEVLDVASQLHAFASGFSGSPRATPEEKEWLCPFLFEQAAKLRNAVGGGS